MAAEDMASRLAEGVVPLVRPGAHLIQRDFNTGVQIRDYDLADAAGNMEAFEVTRALVPALQAARQAHEKHVGYTLHIATLSRSWHVMSTVVADFRAFAAAIEPFLHGLEQHGINEFMVTRRVGNGSLNREAGALGVAAAFSAAGTAGLVLVGQPGDYRGWQSDHTDPGANAIAVLEAAAAAPDNIKKLSVGTGVARHLFVYVYEDNYRPWKDIEYGQLPTRAPLLPVPITTCWLVTTFADSVLLWFYDTNAGWEASAFDRASVGV